MSLFGGGAAASAQSRSRNLVEFKAGKMNLRGTTVSTMIFSTHSSPFSC